MTKDTNTPFHRIQTTMRWRRRERNSRTLAPCRGGLFARRTRSVRVGLAFEKYFLIAFLHVEVSFLALEVTFCPFDVFSVCIVNGVNRDIRG